MESAAEGRIWVSEAVTAPRGVFEVVSFSPGAAVARGLELCCSWGPSEMRTGISLRGEVICVIALWLC